MIIVSTPEKSPDEFRRNARYTNDLVKCDTPGLLRPIPGSRVGFRSPQNTILAEGRVTDVRPGAFMVKVTEYYV